jgi:hypothetical protein
VSDKLHQYQHMSIHVKGLSIPVQLSFLPIRKQICQKLYT